MSNKIECWTCGCQYNENEDFCPECDADIEPNEPKSIKINLDKDNKSAFLGAWILVHGRAKNGKETNPPLYTKICTDDIKNKTTGKRFCRGRYVLFRENTSETMPSLIEDTNDFRIVYHKSIFEKEVIKP